MSDAGGIAGSARRVVAHGAALLRLERELAKNELERKSGVLGAGVFVSIAAGILALFALGFGLAALAAALALVVDWWLALLLVFGLLVLVVVVLVLVARTLFREAVPLKPVQALEEAQRTKEMLRGIGGDRA
jgi:hypothetical protein